MKEQGEVSRGRQIAGAIRDRLTYANVMATIAVFGVLAGGGAYAASKIGAGDIANNAVRAKHVKKNHIRSKHIRNRQIKRKHVSPRAINARHLQDGQVTKEKLAGGVPGGTVEPGVTLRGVFAPTTGAPSIGDSNTGEGVSFGGSMLPADPLIEIVPEGGAPTTNCPGTVVEPEAVAGYLCIYVGPGTVVGPDSQLIVGDPTVVTRGVNYNLENDTITTFGDGRASRLGFEIGLSRTETNITQLEGSWATTA